MCSSDLFTKITSTALKAQLPAASAGFSAAAAALDIPASNQPVIVSAVRTPIGSFNGSLAGLSAPELGTVAIKGALDAAGLSGDNVDEVLMGNVIAAGAGQAPARQAALRAGIPERVPCTTVNKVCASGMKTITMAAQSIALGQNDVVVTGGMESMTNIPYYVKGARFGMKFGHGKLLDGMIHDGLWDVYNDFHMGSCAEHTSRVHNISREEQDNYAIRSYQLSASSTESGAFKNEIVPVTIPGKRGKPDTVIDSDEEFRNVKLDKLPNLRPAFEKDGVVTAANASTINDGASSLIVTSAAAAQALGSKPLARITGYADAAGLPIDFPTAPALAIPRALERAGVSIGDIDLWEINEAFAAVAIANVKILNLDMDKVNVLGGAVSLGHPIGSSGARIVGTLIHALHAQDRKSVV